MAYEIKKAPDEFVVEEIAPDGNVFEFGKTYSFDDKSSGEQLICVLQKRNWDTNLAFRAVAERLHVSSKRLGFAGTKDKRAVTVQRISIWNAKPEDLAMIRLNDLSVQALRYSDERVELGDLWGNRFTIKVYTDKKLGRIPKKIPNYYGVQRFGETRPLTDEIGELVVKGDLQGAVKTYLTKIFPGESDESKSARARLAKDWDYQAALKYFPMTLGFERTLIGHLAERPNDYAGALRKLPKFLKIMFVHALQSRLFNQFLDEAIKQKKKLKEGPLYGYELELENDLEKQVLKKAGFRLEEFFVRWMPEMSSRGERRALFVELKDFEVIEKGDGFVVLRFSLPKGCYATTVVDYLFRDRKRPSS
jgi:tRNA pseudouridine13 synthase